MQESDWNHSVQLFGLSGQKQRCTDIPWGAGVCVCVCVLCGLDTCTCACMLCSQILVQLLSALGLQTKPSVVSRFKQQFKQAWTRNGDNISLLYAGTRAMEGKGLRDGARSVQRTILNNFLDKSKNEAIEMLLSCNARSGDLGQKAVALLDSTDILGQHIGWTVL